MTLKRDITTIELDGRTFDLRPIEYGDYLSICEEVVRHLRSERLETIIGIHDALPRDRWKEEWEQAKEEAFKITTASPEQVMRWCDTIDGVARCVYRQLMPSVVPGRDYKAPFTVEELKRLLLEKADLERKAKAARDATLPQETEGSGQ